MISWLDSASFLRGFDDLSRCRTRCQLQVERQGTLAVASLDHSGFERQFDIRYLLQRHVAAGPLRKDAESIELAEILAVGRDGSQRHGNQFVAFAVLGLVLEAADYPLAPVVLGMVLGPIVETSLRRALLMEGMDLTAVVARPLAGTLLLLAIAFLLAPLAAMLWKTFAGKYKAN